MDPNNVFGGVPLWGAGAAWLLNYLLHSTILLGSVWLLVRTRLLSPGFQDIFWKAALVGALVTAGVQTLGMGGEPLGGRWTVESPSPRSGEIVLLPEAGTTGESVAFAIPAQTEVSSTAETGKISQWLRRVRTGARQGWPQAMLMVWVLGGALCLARLFWMRYRLSRRLRTRKELDRGPLLDLLRRMCAASGLHRPIRLTVSDRVGGPLAWGRSEICLPRRALVDLTPEQQENVLAHEMAHLIRRDPTWRWLGALVDAVFFFQPLNRVARRGIHESAEYLCDDWAVRMTGQNLVMAKCLVEVAGWLQPVPVPASASGMAERGSPLVRRVERLLKRDPASPGLSRRWPVLAAAVLVAATAWISPGFTPDSPRSTDELLFAGVHPEPGGRIPGMRPPVSPDMPPGIEAGGAEAPRTIRWQWREVRRPARVYARVNQVQVPEEIQRHLAVLETHMREDMRPELRKWRQILREQLQFEVQISESGVELQVIPVEAMQEVLEQQSRQLEEQRLEIEWIRDLLEGKGGETPDARITFYLIELFPRASSMVWTQSLSQLISTTE